MLNTDNLVLELLDSDGKLKALLRQKIEKALQELDHKKIAKIIEKGLIEGLSQLDYSDMFDEDVYVDLGKKLVQQMKNIDFNVIIKKQAK